ncbi:BBP7 family outer membrane beta-barrel protein [Rosistilla oblonga]
MVSQTSFMVPENMPPGVSQAMYAPTGEMPPGAVAQVGFCSPLGGGSCDSACDGYCGCGNGGGSCGGGGCGCTGCGPGGLLGQICQGGSLNGLQNLCLFCRGSGCSVCQAPSNAANMLGCLGMLAPYTEAGLCAQRWYDFQAEAIFLSMNGSSANQALTSSGVGATNILMSTDDAESDNLGAGFRLTASMMFGAGGNLEATYFGTNHFSHNQEVVDPTNSLYSAFSDFGVAPPGGYNETDQSAVHSLRYSSDIHSGEANYRRRWVGPYCRFQGSWLLGFRYFDLDESLTFATRNELNFSTATSEFLNSTTQTRNALVGAQLGGDLWWNVHPGINFGVGWKGAIFGNRAEQDTHLFYSGETLVGGVPTRTLMNRDEQASDSTTALMSELQVRMAYRLSYSWTFTAAYWFIGIDGVALGAGNVNTSQANRLFNTNTARDVSINIDDSLTMQGFSVGLEYLW